MNHRQTTLWRFVATATVVSALVGSFAVRAYAAPNTQINYQGKLTDSNSTAVADGTYTLRFRVYTAASGGTALFDETHSLTVSNGLFSALLGSAGSSTADVDWSQNALYLGVEVSNDGEMTPRKRIGSVPSAHFSLDSAKLQGLVTSDFIATSTFSIPNIGSVGSTSATTTFPGYIDVSRLKVGTLSGLLKQAGNIVTTATAGVDYLTDAFREWRLVDGYLAPTTTLPILVNNATSTITNLSMLTSTSTNATSTHTHISTLLTGALARITDAVFTNATSTNATSTNQYISGQLTLASLTGPLQATGGAVSASSTLSVAYGGTGANTFATNGILYGSAKEALQVTAAGTGGNILMAGGSGVPAWVSTSTLLTSLSLTKGNFLVGNDAGVAQATSTIFIDSVGRVGIGTTTPQKLLSLNSAASILRIQNTGELLGDSSMGDLEFFSQDGSAGRSGVFSKIRGIAIDDAGAGGSLNTFNGEGGGLAFYTSNDAIGSTLPVLAERMRINNIGNVGIGSTTPSRLLSVHGNAYISSELFVGGNIVSTSTSASVLPYASTTALSISGTAYIASLTGPLQATGGVVSASSTLSVAYGGTGANTFATNGILYGNTKEALQVTAAGTGGNILMAGGSGVPAWVATTSIPLAGDVGGTLSATVIADNSVDGTDIALGSDATGDLMYYGGADWARLGIGTAGYVLANVGGAPTWVATTTLANISGTLSLASGGTEKALTAVAGGAVYSDADSFEITAAGTAGQILMSGGGGAPSWVSTSTTLANYVPYTGATSAVDLGSQTFTTTGLSTLSGSILVNNATSTITNLVMLTSTSTNATSTYTHISTLLTGALARITDVVFTNATSTNATSTNQYISGQLTLASLTGPLQATGGVVSASSTLSVAYGGTGANTFATNGILYGSAKEALQVTAAGTGGNILMAGGSGVPAWVSTSTLLTSLSLTKGNFLVGNNAGVAQATSTIFIDSVGRVGIGTASPIAQLDIKGASDISTFNMPFNVRLESTNALGEKVGSGILFGAAYSGTAPTTFAIISGVKENATDGNAAGALLFGTRPASGGTSMERMRIASTGNVGIGTTTPQWLLNPFSATAAQLSLSAGAGNAQWAFRNAGGNLYFATTTVAGTATTSTSALTIIGSSGNVGIGTTSPWRTLSVTGTMGISAPTNSNIGDYLCWNTVSKEVTENATACSLSSIRWKENIRELEYGLNEVMRLHPIRYDLKSQYGNAKDQPGFIAEEALTVVPDLVSLGADGLPSGFDYPKLTAVLTKAIQEMNLRIETIASATANPSIESQTFAESFFESVFARTRAWLADAANGVGDLFAGRVKTKELCVRDDSGAETCITKLQLDALLSGNGVSSDNAAGDGGGGGGNTTPALTPTPAPEPEPEATPTPESEPASAPPAEDQENPEESPLDTEDSPLEPAPPPPDPAPADEAPAPAETPPAS
ncbi:MAG TPA: hypothetical protein DIU16_02405 [Candidatus Vogelbacteria bacterium]|nr:hypothetical protein [Candidatus Vogelbacteria bacterium]HCQ92198.1 hypothetical protein [Candidatus Vogelbacteria bacterium]